ncbi:cobalamin biosynthesis protein CbiX [Streptomyces sp. MW-W600-10]|uniref:cobalamin biosynthesis protein CbiX n=1 Tax=Streptomyces sp. MW-W600-10 TaxID=2829819 RepID=UPI001C443F53|nr:cobalamin biosynthesis protein CbiX [Streptomyces sp. MW-W600-10]MBV7243537.1 cobalamin biosynthesis protein CbiX [Streptomyces sp. MW-W600-10]
MTEPVAVIAVCGHEAAYGRALAPVVDGGVSVVSNGRELFRSIAEHGRRGEETVVVPMTLGREPALVADTARTLRAVPAAERGTTVLAEPFGTAQHLVGWLRAAAGRVPEDSALLVTAPSGDPFEDAELYRVAALVRRHGRHPLVEVAFSDGDPDLTEGIRRCRLLGARRVTLLPATFVLPEVPGPDRAERLPVDLAGTAVSAAALRRVLAERVTDARRRLREHGDDGVGAGLTAADNHGHSHTHPPGEGRSHGHAHTHSPGDAHNHPPGEDHPHDNGPATAHRHHHLSADAADRVIRSIA